MSAERPVEPSLVQHVEAVRDELRAEERALEGLPRENARLQAEIQRLEARKQELLGEQERLRQEQTVSAPRLPEVLSAPFDVKVQQGLRRPLLKLLFAGISAALLILLPQGLEAWPYVAPIWGLLVTIGLARRLAPPRWRFGPTSVRQAGVDLRKQTQVVPYEQIREVALLVTPSQKRRGVGTLVITLRNSPPEIMLRNVPEPERLAEWLLSQRDLAIASCPPRKRT
jgi:hypothetical protein